MMSVVSAGGLQKLMLISIFQSHFNNLGSATNFFSDGGYYRSGQED